MWFLIALNQYNEHFKEIKKRKKANFSQIKQCSNTLNATDLYPYMTQEATKILVLCIQYYTLDLLNSDVLIGQA